MSIISAFLKGIICCFSMLTPLSYTGHEGLFRFTTMNLTKGGYDSILPIVVKIPVIISIIYLLRNDLLSLCKTSGCLLKDIKEKRLDLNTDDENKKHLLMVIFGSLTLILSFLFEFLKKGMASNLIVIAFGSLASALFVIMANLVKEKNLKKRNETILNSMAVSVFQVFSCIPGISGFGGMYYAGSICGFTREFAKKYAYIITLVWISFSFLKDIICLFFYEINIIYGVFYYIFFFIGALGISGLSIYLFDIASKNKKTVYFAIYNIVFAIIVFSIWLRG